MNRDIKFQIIDWYSDNYDKRESFRKTIIIVLKKIVMNRLITIVKKNSL